MTPETCNSPDKTRSEPGTEEAQAVNVALAPCPFCGGSTTPKLKLWDGDPPMPGFYVVCDAAGWEGKPGRGCGCSGAYGETKEEAVAAWNRRAAPALPHDVAALVEKLENCPAIAYEPVKQAVAALRSQSSTIASAREVIEQLLPAAEKVLEGLHARIDAAENSAVPVFYGISDLYDALRAARDWKGR